MGNVCVIKRGSVYQYSFDVGKISGKRKRITKSGFKTKNEAVINGNKAYNEYINAGQPFKENNISFSDYLDYWLENYCRVNLKYNTIEKYQYIVNKYLKPELGIYKLNSLTSVKLNSFLVEMCQKHNFSRSYFSNILKVLKGSFREACNTYGFIKYNPTITLRLPKTKLIKNEIKHVYTDEEINKILKRFKNDDAFTCSFLVACYTGMRTGEVYALTWDDIDFENKIINVRHSVYDKPKDEKGRWYIGTPKTLNGIRQIYMGDKLYTILKNYRLKQNKIKISYGKQYKKYHLEEVLNDFGNMVEQRIVANNDDVVYYKNINFVFTKYDGTYVGTDITKYPFKVIHDELGIKARFYDLRGSYATRILNNGIEIRDVADILGHGNIETTENYYISSTSDGRKNANVVFDKIMQSDVIDEISSYSWG